MSSIQGESQGWARHWEVLDRVGLPDFTPDVLWQADVLQRAGIRPLSSNQDRRGPAGNRRPPPGSTSNSSLGGGGGGGGFMGPPRPATAGPGPGMPPTRTEPAAAATGVKGEGAARIIPQGAGQLHPRLRAGLAKQPANRVRPPDVPLGAVLNLSLVEHPELYGVVPAVPPPPVVPRLELAAAGLTGGASAVYSDGPERAGSFQSSNTLPSLAATLGGSHPLAAAGGGGAAAAPVAAAAAAGDGVGDGDGALRAGGSTISFKLPLPAMPMTPTARSSSTVAAPAAAVPRPTSGRIGGGTVTFSSPPEQDPAPSGAPAWGDPDPHQGCHPPSPPQQPQQPHHQTAWRPAAGAGGSGDLSCRTPPAPPMRKSSAGLSHGSLPYAPAAYQQLHWNTQGRSLSGETTAPYGSGSSSVQGPPPMGGGATPRERYKGILERVGRAAAHSHREQRRRPGAVAAAAGSAGVRRRSPSGSSDTESGEDDSGGGGGRTSPSSRGGLARWGSHWVKPLTAINAEASAARAGPPGGTAADAAADGEDGDPEEGLPLTPYRSQAAVAAAAAAAAAVTPRSDGQWTSRSDRSSNLGDGGGRAAAGGSAIGEAGGGAAAGGSQSQVQDEAAAQRLGLAEQAVWQLRRALDELSRFSCMNAVRPGMEEDESVLSQVDARILALRRYDKVEMNPDGRRASIIPPPPPGFPLDAAREYLASAQSGVGGLEQLEEVVASMRKKLQIVVGQDTEDLRKAAAEALADAGPDGDGVSEPGAAAADTSPPYTYPMRRPSSGQALAAANSPLNRSYYNAPATQHTGGGGGEPLSGAPSYYPGRLASATTTTSGWDPSYSGGAGAAAPPPLTTRSTGGPNSHRKPSGASNSNANANAAAAALDQAWALLESLVIQLHDSHASRVEMMDNFDGVRSSPAGGEGHGAGGVRLGGAAAAAAGPGGAAAALLAAAAGAHGGAHRRRRGGGGARGLDRLARLVDVIDEAGAGHGMAEAKEAAAEAAVHSNALRAAVAATLEPKHTEQALYFLAKLALMLQQDTRLPPDAGFLVAAGVDLLLGEVSWLLALLRCASGPGSPHLAALAAALRAYEMQRSYTSTLRAVAERLELAAEEAMDRAAVVERQLAVTRSALQRAGHEVTDMAANMREMERDMKKLKARNDLLEETVRDLEGDIDRVEAAHEARETTLEQADRLAGALRDEHLSRIRARSRGLQVATEGDCSDPRALPPVLKPTAHQYYPITPCVSSRHLMGVSGGRKSGASSPVSRSGTKKHLGKTHGSVSRKAVSRAVSRRVPRGDGGGGSGGEGAGPVGASIGSAAAAAAASLAAARAAAEASDDDDDGPGGSAASAAAADNGDSPQDGSSLVASSPRLGALKRGGAAGGARVVSWIDRSPERRFASPEVRPPSGLGDGDGDGAPVDVGVPGGASAAPSRGEGAEGGKGRRSRSPSPRSRPKSNRAHKKGAHGAPSEAPSSPRLPEAPADPNQPPSAASLAPHQLQLQQQQEEEEELLQLQQQPKPLARRGVDGLEYWTQPSAGPDGDGAGSLTGDGAEPAGLPVVVRDAELERAAMDMFSDVFGRQQSGRPTGRFGVDGM